MKKNKSKKRACRVSNLFTDLDKEGEDYEPIHYMEGHNSLQPSIKELQRLRKKYKKLLRGYWVNDEQKQKTV